MYEDIYEEYKNRPKRTFASKEEFREWLDSIMGSITDETFVAPEDAYPVYANDNSKVLS